MKRILVPVDGSPRSLIALEQLKTTFSPKAFEVVLVMVRENTGYALSLGEESKIREDLDKKLKSIAKIIDKYSVITRSAIGRAGARIIEAAKEYGVEMIVMTKSTKPGTGSTIGLTASYIIRHAQCDVMIVKETETKKIESYRGAIYKRAKGTVALRGQLSLKQSECLIPSVKGDVIYHIDVTRGRVRFLHRSFNAVTKEWDLPPSNGQQEIYEIEAGVSIKIPVNATGDGKMADRIRIINRSMKTEAVFNYEITTDKRVIKPETDADAETRVADEEPEVETESTTPATQEIPATPVPTEVSVAAPVVPEAMTEVQEAVAEESHIPEEINEIAETIETTQENELEEVIESVDHAELEKSIDAEEPETAESDETEVVEEPEATESEEPEVVEELEAAESEELELVEEPEVAEPQEPEETKLEESEGDAEEIELLETEEDEDNDNLLESLVSENSGNTIAAIERLCATGAIDAVELIKALDELESRSEAALELDADAELKAEPQSQGK